MTMQPNSPMQAYVTEMISVPSVILKTDPEGPALTLEPGVIIEPQTAVKLQFTTATGSFQGLLAPHREESNARASVAPTGQMIVLKGWIYLVGTQPVAATEWVVAAAESTSLIIEVVPGGGMHRVVLKNTAPGKTVTCTFQQGAPPPPAVINL